MKQIEEFLGKRQSYYETSDEEFSRRVHAVWYVFSALDNRVKEDHGLLKMLDRYGVMLPLLLIMTHHECATAAFGERKVNLVMEEVLDCISEDEMRCRLRESMIRVENNVEVDIEGEVVIEINVNREALNEVVERTNTLMEEGQWMTWAACQAVSMKMKVEASVSHILKKRLQQWLASTSVASLPGVHQAQMAIMFASFTHSLAQIWNASPNLEKAIVSCKCFQGERTSAVMANLGQNITSAANVFVGVLAIILMSTQFLHVFGSEVPFPLSSPAVVLQISRRFASVVSSAVQLLHSQPRYASKLLLSYGLLVLGAIMYVHVHDVSSPAQQGSVDHYSRMFEEFVGSPWAQQISAISDRYTSMWDASFYRRKETQQLVSDIVRFFETLSRSP